MDLDVYVAAHAAEWSRLEQLVKRAKKLRGAEVDELVDLYQRVATHLSVLQSSRADPALLARLSSLVGQARSAVAGTRQAAWRDAVRILTVDFPVVVWRARWWCLGSAVGSIVVGVALAVYFVTHPEVQSALVDPATAQQLVDHDFADYYRQAPSHDFAAKVFTNNARIAAAMIALGILLGLPVLYFLFENAVNVGVAGGLLASRHHLGLFFGLILPHGLLELTAVFIAGGLGLRIGWTVVDPGPLPRSQALAAQVRALITGAIGLALTLFVSGLLEGFVTPSGLPTWLRIGIGATVWVAFMTYVVVLGRRADQAGATGDLDAALRGDVLPTA